MYAFEYEKSDSLDAATAAAKGDPEATFLAGGQTLLPSLKLRLAAPSRVVDLGGIGDLKGITVDGNGVTIGAMTRHMEVETSSDVADAIPALAHLAGHIGDPQVRNRGTIGGSLANNDPAADYPAAVLALNATVKTDRREIAADDFFKGLFETALEDGEIITSVTFPKPRKAGYMKFPHPASRFALVGVFVAQTDDGVRVAVTGAAQDGVFRSKELEDALSKDWSPDAAGAVKLSADGMNADIHGSAEYRAHLVAVMAKRAVAAAQ